MSDPIVPTDFQALQEDLQTIEQSKTLLQTEMSHAPAVEGVLGDMFSAIASGFNTLRDRVFKLKVGGVPIEDAKPATDGELDEASKITPKTFVDFAGIEFQSMEGFKGTYTEYSTHLINSLGFYKETLSPTLKSYEQLLGALITNKSSRTSYEDTTAAVTRAANARQANASLEQGFWVPGNHQVLAKVGSVVTSAGDVKAIKANSGKISSALRDGSLKEIKTRVDRLDQLVSQLSAGISKGKYSDITKAQLTNLSNELTELAKQVEHYGLVVYRSHVFLQAVARLQEKVSKLF